MPPKVDVSRAYKYPHEYGGWVEQQYLPDKVKDKRYYFPSGNGAEAGKIPAKYRNADEKKEQ